MRWPLLHVLPAGASAAQTSYEFLKQKHYRRLRECPSFCAPEGQRSQPSNIRHQDDRFVQGHYSYSRASSPLTGSCVSSLFAVFRLVHVQLAGLGAAATRKPSESEVSARERIPPAAILALLSRRCNNTHGQDAMRCCFELECRIAACAVLLELKGRFGGNYREACQAILLQAACRS